jgi:hypothetical protein
MERGSYTDRLIVLAAAVLGFLLALAAGFPTGHLW